MDLISDSVRRFLFTSIPSVPHLETLMLLWREQERAFLVDEIASRLYVSVDAAKALAEDLARAELLGGEDDGARYRVRTEPPELHALLQELDRTYSCQVRAVAELIHSNVDRKAHRFATSFYWRKP
jgi:hypothetical protein